MTASGPCRRSSGHAKSLSFEESRADERTFDAVIRGLEVIGEAAKNVPGDLRTRSPDLEWRKITGLGDILVHHCFGVDAEIVWDVIRGKLPALEDAIRGLIEG